jgi:hypothetical protein
VVVVDYKNQKNLDKFLQHKKKYTFFEVNNKGKDQAQPALKTKAVGVYLYGLKQQ